MTKEPSSDKWGRKIKFLTQMLMISGAVNISFFATFFYLVLKEKQLISSSILPPLSYAFEKNIKEYSNNEYLSFLSSLTYRELLFLLSNKQLVEEGYTKRDLALGYLVNFHHFNLDKALNNINYQKRKIIFEKDEETVKMMLFPGLSDYHFEGIIHFAYREKWPLTSEGLFSLLNKWPKPRDKTLEQACIVTEEFEYIRLLFNDSTILSEDFLDLIAEVPWELIKNFINSQKQNFDFSNQLKRQFLISCLEKGSKTSAKLLLQTDMLYITKKFDDHHILLMLKCLTTPTEEVEQFCVELLKSARSDDVRKNSSEKLYLFANEQIPIYFDHEEALKRFVYEGDLQDKWKKEQEPSLREIIWGTPSFDGKSHIVQEGDNLWKIARIYKVDIDELIKLNQLDEDQKIFPGTLLILPSNH